MFLSWSRLVRPAAVTVLSVGAATLARWALDPWLGSRQEVTPYYAAVALAAWYGGWWPGLVTAGLGFLSAEWLFIEPRGALNLSRPEHLAGLGAFAAVSLAIATTLATLRAIAHRARSRVEEELRVTRALHRIGMALVGELDLRSLVQRVIDATTELVGAEFGAFFYTVREGDGESFMLFVLSGAPREKFAHFPVPRNTELFAPTFRGLGVVRADDITADARYGRNPPHHGLPEGHLPVRSYLAVPVVSRSTEVLGGVFYGHPEAGVFRQREEDLVVDVTSQVATAIDNAHLVKRQRDAEQRFRITLSSIGEAVIATDTQGRVTFLNPAAESLTDHSEEAVGRPLSDILRLIHEETRKPVPSPVARVLERGGAIDPVQPSLVVSRDGTERPVSHSVAPIVDANGELTGAVLVLHDETERRRAAQVHLRLSAIVESSQDAVISKDLEGNVTSWNPGAEALYGYTAEEMVGQPIARLVPPDQPDDLPVILERLERGERVAHYETIRRRKDGRRVHVSVRISPIRGADGTILGASAIARDITDHKRAERALQRSEERFHLAEDVARFGTFDWDLVTQKNRWSPGLLALYGLAPEEFQETYEAWRERVHADDLERAEAAVRRAISTGELLVDFRVVRPDSSVVWLQARAKVLHDEDGRPVRMLGINVDITERKRAEEALQEADRRKTEFLATLAHELRNPLAPIRTALELLRVADDNPETLEQARSVMERQLPQMVRLIDDLLDVSRITRDRLVLRKQRIELGEVIQSAVEATRPFIARLDHTLAVDMPDTPIHLHADSTRLAQVVSNLLDNAAKYTPPGGRIRLKVEREEGQVAISVSDTGLGIAAENMPRLFELFSQICSGREAPQEGLGIGLALVRRLVEKHQGTVEAHSEGVGRGSRFVVRLPVLAEVGGEERADPGGSDPGASASATLRIAVVDDNRDSAESLALLLRLQGHRTCVAHDGPAAIEATERFRPQVLLLDIGLPGLDGYEVARRVREQPWGKDVLLVAVTGWGQEEDRKRASDAGFDHHVTKPIEPAVLQRLLDRKAAQGKASP